MIIARPDRVPGPAAVYPQDALGFPLLKQAPGQLHVSLAVGRRLIKAARSKELYRLSAGLVALAFTQIDMGQVVKAQRLAGLRSHFGQNIKILVGKALRVAIKAQHSEVKGP